ncbi:hypothetical protein TrST_g5836 [Triparma strigata]|uniref:GMP phosphodiesterase delta subunit domain-containing protein n=1 Tax=Triparma strigata TaxID=1606541 RepID=A0A9W7EK25_9STRA|nr:hypothetical protein TrST_g5836 [Triparma strigata]
MESKYDDDEEEVKSGDYGDSKGGDEDSEDEEAAVEREFKALLNTPLKGELAVSKDPMAQRIAEGFTINWMNMRDAENGEMMWESGEWGEKMWRKELKARIPADILSCRAVSREINFSSIEKMESFKLEQRIFFQGVCIEEWFFDFGFVIPGSTNSWQQIIEAAEESEMMTAEALSGNITIETSFYDGDYFIAKSLVRVFYV